MSKYMSGDVLMGIFAAVVIGFLVALGWVAEKFWL